jgi:hypothetical protein
MISKSKSESSTIKIDKKQLNGIKYEGLKEDRPSAYILKRVLREYGIEELTDQEFEFRVHRLNSAMEIPAKCRAT